MPDKQEISDAPRTYVGADGAFKPLPPEAAEDISYPAYLFAQGTNFRAYELFGPHRRVIGGEPCYTFRVWAPNAAGVSLLGDFNGWDTSRWPMHRRGGGIWELSAAVAGGALYKYAVRSQSKKTVFKSDPYGRFGETESKTASIVCDLGGLYDWKDKEYLQKRERRNVYRSPLNIYELNLCSWMQRRESNDPATFVDEPATYLNYRDIADRLAPYLVKMGFNCAEVMPLCEYPFIDSWGYQCGCYYAPTARFGRPEDLMYFVDRLHADGISVIMDWAGAHFPRDAHGLYMFDGGPLYESPSKQKRELVGWGTHQFDFGRTEVQSFLVSNALFWLEQYHLDGLRVDAVTSMLYLDFEHRPGQWSPNTDGTNLNYDGAALLRKLNTAVAQAFPKALMCAEEASAYKGVTAPVADGGLGFTFKWNMGWMHDALAYIKYDPVHRQYHHTHLTFPLMYAFNERFILPISHDEVVHGKKSLLDKMPGSYDEKFASVRAFLGYMYAHPGKKLLFMGSELGQFIEWNYRRGIDFELLEYERHAQLQEYVSELCRLYLSTRALWEDDDSWAGFQWIFADDAGRNVLSFMRRSRRGAMLAAVMNFSSVNIPNYRLGLPKPGEYAVVLDSDEPRFGGAGLRASKTFHAEAIPCHGFAQSAEICLPPLSCVWFKLYRAEKTK